MKTDVLASVALRTAFAGSLFLIATACLERVVSFFGYTILPIQGMTYTPGRLLEFAAVFLIVVIAFLLRQVRDELRRAKS